MSTIAVNPPKTPVTEGSGGKAPATMPNVCKMPGPPAPFVPTPLPNIGNASDNLSNGTTTVKFEGKKVAIKGSSFKSTPSGDVASQGTGGGIISSRTQGKTEWVAPGALDVKAEGKNIQLLGDAMTNNGGSPTNSAAIKELQDCATPADDAEEKRKQGCLEARAKIYEKFRKLVKELKKYSPADDARGGFPMRGGKLTKPGGHYTEIKDLQRGLKNDHEKFTKECAGTGVSLDRTVDQAANRPVERPPGC